MCTSGDTHSRPWPWPRTPALPSPSAGGLGEEVCTHPDCGLGAGCGLWARLLGPWSVVKSGSLWGRLLVKVKAASTRPPYPEPGTLAQGGRPPGAVGLAPSPPLVLTFSSTAERLQEGFPLPMPANVQAYNLVLQSHQVGPKVSFRQVSLNTSNVLPESSLYASPVASTLPLQHPARWVTVHTQDRVRLRKAT